MTDKETLETIITSIEIRISLYEQLASELIKQYRADHKFKTIPKKIHQQYDALGNVAEGLQEALNIIMKEWRE